MKKALLLSVVAATWALSGSAVETIDKLEAFPGAEGYGRYVTGGRGGKVYHVTTLEDNNQPGSFRYACSQSGPRTIVFDVSGNIHLKSSLDLRNGNVTIAGQTAPGDGICVTDYPFNLRADNVIIRFMRFRVGNENITVNGADGWDALGSLDRKNIIVDHCSVSWSIDECLSFSGTTNTTVQWSIVSQSLVNAGHSKGGHGYGGNWGGQYGSYHHNLLAHHTSRAPRLGPRPTTQLNEVMDMRNNVMFNYNGEGCYGGEGMNVNIVNNFYQPGPGNGYANQAKETRIAAVGIRTYSYCHDSGRTATNIRTATGETVAAKDITFMMVPTGDRNNRVYVPNIRFNGKNYPIIDDKYFECEGKQVNIGWNSYGPALHLIGKYYVDGNDNYNKPEVKDDNWGLGMYNQINWNGWDHLAQTAAGKEECRDKLKLDTPIDFIYTTTHSPEDAYELVLKYAGASLSRDALDEMIVSDARNNEANSGTGEGNKAGFINTPDDITYPEGIELDGHLPALKSTEAKIDSDGDGIPDEWEMANGLNPNDPEDGAAASDKGFTNLELYLHSLVAHIMEGENANGKMLNANLTYADEGVDLPVYQDPTTGIDQIVIDDNTVKGNGRIYNIMGIEVKAPLAPGIYIRDGKKFIVR